MFTLRYIDMYANKLYAYRNKQTNKQTNKRALHLNVLVIQQLYEGIV